MQVKIAEKVFKVIGSKIKVTETVASGCMRPTVHTVKDHQV